MGLLRCSAPRNDTKNCILQNFISYINCNYQNLSCQTYFCKLFSYIKIEKIVINNEKKA